MTSAPNPLTQVADEALLYRIGHGDPQAFDTLYARHGAGVYRFAYSLCGAAQPAEDCAQEVFLSVWQDSSGFRDRNGGVRAWLLGIARHKMIDRFRQQSRYEFGLDAAALSADAPTPDQSAGSGERAERLRRAILALPLRYREVVVLCELEELSYIEASTLIGCPVGTVRSRLYRARAQLATKLRSASVAKGTAADRAEACE